jgi:hypothetical protein
MMRDKKEWQKAECKKEGTEKRRMERKKKVHKKLETGRCFKERKKTRISL